MNGFTPVYTATDTNLVSVTCKLDYIIVPCGPVSGLSEGPHRFGVRVLDCCANAEGETRDFIVDTLAPNTKITSGPAATTSSRTVTFKFQKTNNEYGDVYFKGQLDGGAWKSCTSPKTYTVARGRHTFKVKGVDQAGNQETTPAVRTWKRI